MGVCVCVYPSVYMCSAVCLNIHVLYIWSQCTSEVADSEFEGGHLINIHTNIHKHT